MSEEFLSGSKLGETKEQTARAVEDFRNAAASKARQFRDTAEQQAGAFRDQAENQADQLRESAGEQWETTKLRAEELRVELEHYVRENPTKSVLIVFGVGVFMGMMLRR